VQLNHGFTGHVQQTDLMGSSHRAITFPGASYLAFAPPSSSSKPAPAARLAPHHPLKTTGLSNHVSCTLLQLRSKKCQDTTRCATTPLNDQKVPRHRMKCSTGQYRPCLTKDTQDVPFGSTSMGDSKSRASQIVKTMQEDTTSTSAAKQAGHLFCFGLGYTTLGLANTLKKQGW
jgi:hypothetical protein